MSPRTKALSVKNQSIFVIHYDKTLKVQKIKNITEDEFICRICLKRGSIPILDNKASFDVAEAILTFGKIKVDHADTFPKKLCKICYQFLSIAVLFRKVATQTQDILSGRKLDPTETKDVVKTEDSYIGEQFVDQQVNVVSSKLEKRLLNTRETINEAKEDNDCKDFILSDNEDNFSSDNQRNQRKDKTYSEKITCEICKKVISRSYYKHHKTIHDPNHKNYQCEVCGKSFRLRCSYYNHSLRHRSDFSYKCQHCPYQGKYKELLRAHMRSHTQEQNYMCTECPAKFRFKSNLNKHILRHKEPNIKCDSCSRAFHSQNDLKQHVEVDHLSIRSHVCDECGKAFGSRKGMMKHQKTVHKRKKMMTGRMPAYLLAQKNAISSV